MLASARQLAGQTCRRPFAMPFPTAFHRKRGLKPMPAITLPDGSVRQFDAPVTGTTVAEAIGPGLARAALAMKLDGKTVDLSTSIDRDARVVFITRRDDDALGMIR